MLPVSILTTSPLLRRHNTPAAMVPSAAAGAILYAFCLLDVLNKSSRSLISSPARLPVVSKGQILSDLTGTSKPMINILSPRPTHNF
jgi:hypothetical protein